MSISNRYTSTGFVPVATANVKSASGASCSSGADGASGASSASMAPTATSGVTTRGTTTYTARAPQTNTAATGPAATGPAASASGASGAPAATTPVSTAPAETPGVSNTPSVTGSNGAGTRHYYFARHDFYDKQGEPIPFANLSSDVKSALIDQATSIVDFSFNQAVECLEDSVSRGVSNLEGAYTNWTSNAWDEEGYGGCGPDSVTVKAKYIYSWDDNGHCTAKKISDYEFVDRDDHINKHAMRHYDQLLDVLKRQSGVHSYY